MKVLLLALLIGLPLTHQAVAQSQLNIEALIEQVRIEARAERRHNQTREARFIAAHQIKI